jgi:hypothetical protein
MQIGLGGYLEWIRKKVVYNLRLETCLRFRIGTLTIGIGRVEKGNYRRGVAGGNVLKFQLKLKMKKLY